MVFSHVPLHNLYVMGFAYLAHPHRHRPNENRLAIFRDPYQMVLDVILGVTRRPILFRHTDVLPEGVA